jgi:hypothetical protein
MIWVAWRQQRTELTILGVVLALLCAVFIPYGLSARGYADDHGVAACAGDAGPRCGQVVDAFENHVATAQGITDWFALLPLLLAILLAAPIALELDRRGYRLAWTQSISRRRWLVAKLGLAVGGAAAAGAAVSVLLSWWRAPINNVKGRIEPTSFQLQGLAPVVYTVFCVALILALGVVVRRAVPAIGLAIVLFLAVRIAVETWARPHFAAALELPSDSLDDRSWVLSTSDAGLARYQPDTRFWSFQLIETGLFLALAALLLAVVAHRVLRVLD